jgi:hypothetical protein
VSAVAFSMSELDEMDTAARAGSRALGCVVVVLLGIVALAGLAGLVLWAVQAW